MGRREGNVRIESKEVGIVYLMTNIGIPKIILNRVY